MNNQNTAKLIIFLIVVVLLTVYCGNARAQLSNRYSPPPNVLPPPQPTQQNQQEPIFYRWNSRTIIESFKKNGLEAEDIKPAYILGPAMPVEGTMFFMPSFGENIGGYASSYNSKNALKKMKKHYLQMNKDPESPAWWIFEKDNILLLISGKIPRDTVTEYEKVLLEMGKN